MLVFEYFVESFRTLLQFFYLLLDNVAVSIEEVYFLIEVMFDDFEPILPLLLHILQFLVLLDIYFVLLIHPEGLALLLQFVLLLLTKVALRLQTAPFKPQNVDFCEDLSDLRHPLVDLHDHLLEILLRISVIDHFEQLVGLLFVHHILHVDVHLALLDVLLHFGDLGVELPQHLVRVWLFEELLELLRLLFQELYFILVISYLPFQYLQLLLLGSVVQLVLVFLDLHQKTVVALFVYHVGQFLINLLHLVEEVLVILQELLMSLNWLALRSLFFRRRVDLDFLERLLRWFIVP